MQPNCALKFLSYPKGMEFMKKMLALVLTVLLCFAFAGCKVPEPVEPPELSFPSTEKVMPVQRLVITEGGGTLEGVGFVQEDSERFCLSGKYMDGEAEQEGKLYYYAVPDMFFEVCEREGVEGVLIFDGVPYGVRTEEDGTAILCTLDGDTDTRTWHEFFAGAYEARNP